MSQTNDDKIKLIVSGLRDLALQDIKNASYGGAKMGAFILCSCLIDSISGFREGRNTTKVDYTNFVNSYLTMYNSKNLYEDLRCKLVHNYSEGGSYLFSDDNKIKHLSTHNSKTVINLEDFIIEIENALNVFIAELHKKSNTQLRNKAIQRFNTSGIIQVMNYKWDPNTCNTITNTGVSGTN